MHAFTRGIPLRTVAEMRGAVASFDTVAKCAIARLPKNGAAPRAIVAVIAVMIASRTNALAPAAEAADTS